MANRLASSGLMSAVMSGFINILARWHGLVNKLLAPALAEIDCQARVASDTLYILTIKIISQGVISGG